MSKFDEKYLAFCRKQPDFKSSFDSYIEYIEGNALCDCGHGCRDYIADNGAKIAGIMRALQQGLSAGSLDALAEKDPAAFRHDLHEEMWIKAVARNAPKN